MDQTTNGSVEEMTDMLSDNRIAASLTASYNKSANFLLIRMNAIHVFFVVFFFFNFHYISSLCPRISLNLQLIPTFQNVLTNNACILIYCDEYLDVFNPTCTHTHTWTTKNLNSPVL